MLPAKHNPRLWMGENLTIEATGLHGWGQRDRDKCWVTKTVRVTWSLRHAMKTQRHRIILLLNLFPQKSDIPLALLLLPVSTQILLHVVFDVREQGLLAEKQAAPLTWQRWGWLAFKGTVGTCCRVQLFSQLKLPLQCRSCWNFLTRVSAWSQDWANLRPRSVQVDFFNTNLYVAETFKACDGKVGDNFSRACQKMSQMAHVTPHSHQLRSTRLTMYVLWTDKLCHCIFDGALVLAKVILKTS